jgi:hypothetical protein
MTSPNELCAVFLCDKNYFNKFLYTCEQLVTNGKYTGQICLVIGDDLNNDPMLQHPLIVQNNIIITHFPNLPFTHQFLYIQEHMEREPHWFRKIFQYHKLHLFNTYFKRWNYIFYLDCGLTIFDDVNPVINERKPNALLAHSDAFPTYKWKLHNQFEKKSAFFSSLSNKYNLNIDYCQTTIMLYDTSIIEEDTFNNLYNLMTEFPISITNDQGIIALYFTNIKPFFQQIQIKNDDTYFYDYHSRQPNSRYIMLKNPNHKEY